MTNQTKTQALFSGAFSTIERLQTEFASRHEHADLAVELATLAQSLEQIRGVVEEAEIQSANLIKLRRTMISTDSAQEHVDELRTCIIRSLTGVGYEHLSTAADICIDEELAKSLALADEINDHLRFSGRARQFFDKTWPHALSSITRANEPVAADHGSFGNEAAE